MAAAHLALWLPVPLAVVAVTLSDLVRRPLPTAALVASLGVAIAVADLARAPVMLRLPTDVLEARAVAAWRATLPPDARVIYLADAPRRVVSLPVYDCGAGGPRPLEVKPGDPLAPSLAVPAHGFYVRDSLCDTPEGRRPCQRLEATIRAAGGRLVPERTLRLPARESMIGLGYPSRTVSVTFFQIRPRAAPAPGAQK